jgi:hypothetical protein
MKLHPGDKISSLTVKEVTQDYALCECSCGKVLRLRTYDVIFGKVRSCGCLSTIQENSAIKLNRYFNKYQRSAKEKGYTFNIPLEIFKQLIEANCHYCGSPPRNLVNLYGRNLLCNGIDRKNQSIGYEIDNALSCCRYCNYSKGILPYDEFIDHIKIINQHFFTDNIQGISNIFIDPRYYHTIFSIYKSRGLKNDISFNLSISEVMNLVASACFYCGGGFTNVLKVNTIRGVNISHNGIDRLDSKLGYTPKNTVPCCKKCNYIKRDYDFLFFLDHIKAIYNRRKILC